MEPGLLLYQYKYSPLSAGAEPWDRLFGRRPWSAPHSYYQLEILDRRRRIRLPRIGCRVNTTHAFFGGHRRISRGLDLNFAPLNWAELGLMNLVVRLAVFEAPIESGDVLSARTLSGDAQCHHGLTLE